MPGPTRIDTFLGLFLSCLGHAALIGTILISNANSPAPSKPSSTRESVLIVDFISLDGQGKSQKPSMQPESSNAVPALQNAPVAPALLTAADHAPPSRFPANAAPAMNERTTMPASSGGAATSDTAGADLDDYQRRLYELVARQSRYPSEAKRLRLSGVTYLAFQLDHDGNVMRSWIHRSSGSAVLDNAALAALDRAKPLPPLPASLPAHMDFVIEIDSSVQQVAFRATTEG